MNGNPIVEGFIEAIRLIVSLDPQVVEITIRSLYVSLTATFFAALIALPLGALIYFYEFRGKHAVVSTLQTLYALPTVIVGLVMFLLLSNIGPFGFLRLLYTPGGMIVTQTVLIIPLLMGLTVSALSGIDRDKRYTITALGREALDRARTKTMELYEVILETMKP